MRGPECHPWAEKILTGGCEWRKFLGAIGRRLRREGLRAGHRRRESEGQKENLNRLCQARPQAVPSGRAAGDAGSKILDPRIRLGPRACG